MIGYNSEEITTDVMTLRDRDLALSQTPESASSYGMIIATCIGHRQRSSAT